MDTDRVLSRRSALRLLSAAALAAVPAAGLTGPARAGRSWCRADPTFRVDGLIGNVWVAGELDRAYDTTGPIKLRFVMPAGSSVELLYADPGFGKGYDISYHYTEKLKNDHKKIELEVEVLVPAVSDDLPVLVEFVPDGTIEVADKKEGKTNKWIKVKTQLKKAKETKEEKEAREAAEKAAKEAADAAEKAAKEAEDAAEKAAKEAEDAAKEAAKAAAG